MRRRLLVSTALIALAAVLALGVPLGIIGSRLLVASQTGRLEREADRAAARIAEAHGRGAAIDRALLAALAAPGHRLEVRLPDGRLISGGDALPGARVRVLAGDVTGGARVAVLAPRDERTEHVGGVWLAVVVLSLVAIGAAAGLAILQARRLAGPLERLAARATAVGHPGFDRRPAPSGVEELDAVEHALVEADERIAALLRREREFSANVSHQLRSPITGLRMRLEELQAIAPSAPARSEATAALAQVDRLLATIDELEALARAQEVGDDAADLAGVARAHARAGWAGAYAAARRPLRVTARGPALVRLGEEPLRQLLDVLLDNALRHGAGATTVAVAASDGWARLVVEDEGPGVPAGHEEHVFERRGSLAGGSGVGLALARELARRAGGELSLTRPARFETRLPAAR